VGGPAKGDLREEVHREKILSNSEYAFTFRMKY
jgi:hypothetical protein